MFSTLRPNLTQQTRRAFSRLNCQIPDDKVATFPVQFLPMILIGDVMNGVDEAISMYPSLLSCRMIVMPFMKETHSSVVVIVNPAGIVSEEFSDRSSSFMLVLDPGDEITGDKISTISRRVRLFLNGLSRRMGHDLEKNKFSCRTFKSFKPSGKWDDVYCSLFRPQTT